MKTSESILTLAKALPKAQAAIGVAKKDVNNTFFKSKYADLSSVIDACKAGLNAAGFTFLQPVTSSERGVVIETILLHESGEWISESLEVPVSKNDAQGVGSAITYGRRYGLQALVGVPAEDDDGNAAAKNAPTRALPTAIPANVEGVDGFAALPVDMQTFLRDHAKEITGLFTDGKPMKQYVADLSLSIEHQLALWTLLRSDVRAAYKKEKELTRPTPAELATQA